MKREIRKRKRDPNTGRLLPNNADAVPKKRDLWSPPHSPGIEGFAHWFNQIQPHIQNRYRQWVPFQFTEGQGRFIKEAFAHDPDTGTWCHDTILHISPRRHGKNYLYALIVLWLTCSRRNYITQLSGNTEKHSRAVQLNLLENIIRNTPKLKIEFGPKLDKNLTRYEISHPRNHSRIQLNAGSFATAFGEGFSLLWHSDRHALLDDSPLNAMQSSLLDTHNTLFLMDSNVDSTGGPIHALEQAAKDDRTFYTHRTKYRSWEEFREKAPPWIDRNRAERIKATTLEPEWKRDILGQRADSKNSLFSSQTIEICRDSFTSPVSSVEAIAKGRAYRIGAGLDRSKSLIGGDSTVFTVTAKIASLQHGEPEFYVLNQTVFPVNTASLIKRQMVKDHDKYKIDNAVLENYEVADLSPFLHSQNIPHELVSAHDKNQNASFPELHRIAKEGRLHFSRDLQRLAREMSTFSYIQRTGGKYSFGHRSQSYHDDTVYSLNWSIFATRSVVLDAYTLKAIQCLSKSHKRAFCYLMGGDMVLNCSRNCIAHREVMVMHKLFSQFNIYKELDIPTFYLSKVKLTGPRIRMAA